MGTIWEDKVGVLDKGTIDVMYGNIEKLFKGMQNDPNNADKKAIGDRLQADMGSSDFRRKLDASLADDGVRNRIIQLVEKNPTEFRKHLEELSQHPENTAAIVNAMPMSGAAKPTVATVANTSPSSTPPAEPRKTHFNTHAGRTGESGDTPVTPHVEAASAPVTPPSSQTAGQSPAGSPAEVKPAVLQTGGAAPADDGNSMSPQMVAFLKKPENAGFKDLLKSLNDDQTKVVQTTFKKMSGDNPGMLDQLEEEQRKHPEFFKNLLANLQNGPKDEAGFQTALTDSMNSVKTLGGIDMIMGFVGSFIAPLLKGLGMDKFAASLTDGSFAEKIAGNKMASTEIAKTVDEAAPMISMVSGLFNDNSGASPKANGQPATPQTNVAATTGATPSLPNGNLVGTSTNSYATTASATPGQTIAVNGATYPTVNPTLVAASTQPNPFLQPHL